MPSGLSIEQELRPGVTWRGRDAVGRRVVLKKLPADCLCGGRLHPAIAQRLSRLREAPVTGLATLFGVEETSVGVVMVGEFINGTPVADLSPDERARHAAAARKLIEALHRSGLVHGAVLPGNFIVEPDGRLRLIDPSPFLYDDPAADWADYARLWPDATAATEPAAPVRRWHWPTLAAAAGLAVAAGVGAAAWAWHVAGRAG